MPCDKFYYSAYFFSSLLYRPLLEDRNEFTSF